MAKYLLLKHYRGGPDAAGHHRLCPLPETGDLVADWHMIDVESHERADELCRRLDEGALTTSSVMPPPTPLAPDRTGGSLTSSVINVDVSA